MCNTKFFITFYYSNNGAIILIITRSIMGNFGSIITYYWLPQLGDVGCY